jgi:hypothetical protein
MPSSAGLPRQSGPVTTKLCKVAIDGDRCGRISVGFLTTRCLSPEVSFSAMLDVQTAEKVSCVSKVPKSWILDAGDTHSRRCRAASL